MTIHILSICLLSSTTIYSANNESKKPESNVPLLQCLIMKNLVKNRVPLEVVAPVLNNNLRLKGHCSQESLRLGDWHDIKKINEEYTKLRKEIYCHRKPLNSQNARIIFFPGGPWDNEHNKKYKICLDCCICLGYGKLPKSREGYPPHVESTTCCCTLLCTEQFLLYDGFCSHPLASHLLCITLSPLTYPLCAATLVACLHFHYYQEQKTILKAIIDPKTWQSKSRKAPQSLTMSEDVDANGSSNFAALSNMLNIALKMKDD